MGLWDSQDHGNPGTLLRISSQPPPPQDLLMVEAQHPIPGGTDRTRGHRMVEPGMSRKQLLLAAARFRTREISSGIRNLLSTLWLLHELGVTMGAGKIGTLLVAAYLEEHRARTLSTTTGSSEHR